MKEKWRVWRRLVCVSMAVHSEQPRGHGEPPGLGDPWLAHWWQELRMGTWGEEGMEGGEETERGLCGGAEELWAGGRLEKSPAGVRVLSPPAAVATTRVSPLCQPPRPVVYLKYLASPGEEH